MLPKCRYIGMQHIWPIPMYLSTEILNLIHRDGVWILNPDVSPLKSVSQIHRDVPETAKSDVSPQKQVSKYIGDAS